MIRTALWLADQGIHVIQVTRTKKPLPGCRRCRAEIDGTQSLAYDGHGPDACPCLPGGRCHGSRAATTDRETIIRWWTEEPRCGIGVVAEPSDLLIVDVDVHPVPLPEDPAHLVPGVALPAGLDLTTIQTGDDTLALLTEARKVPYLLTSPLTLTVETPSGGVQYWYRVPQGTRWRPSVGRDGKGLAWQVDIRAGWTYGIAPGSVSASGTYRAIGDTRTIAPLPSWLARDLERTGHRVRETQLPTPRRSSPWGGTDRGVTSSSRYLTAVVARELEAVASTTSGGNHALNKAAFALGTLVGAGHLGRDAVAAALLEAALHCGLPEGDSRRTIKSGLRAGEARPRYTLGGAA